MHAPLKIALVASLLTACGQQAKDEAVAATPTAEATKADAATFASDDRQAKLEGKDMPDNERLVIRNASLHLRAESPGAVATAAAALAQQVGGFVASSDTQGAGEHVYRIDTSVRVPADRFQHVLAQLREHGELLQETITGEDVTEQHADLGARLRSQRGLEERLLAILETAESVEDVLEVEGRLVLVRTEIERLDARVRGMEQRAAMATIGLVVEAPSRVSVTEAEGAGSRIGRAVEDAGGWLVGGLVGVIRFVGAVSPVAVLVMPGWILGARAWRRRRREKMLVAAARGGATRVNE
ncbi:MAG: DUF4349 domain-containing protein [Myxococcota bacterium]